MFCKFSNYLYFSETIVDNAKKRLVNIYTNPLKNEHENMVKTQYNMGLAGFEPTTTWL